MTIGDLTARDPAEGGPWPARRKFEVRIRNQSAEVSAVILVKVELAERIQKESATAQPLGQKTPKSYR